MSPTVVESADARKNASVFDTSIAHMLAIRTSHFQGREMKRWYRDVCQFSAFAIDAKTYPRFATSGRSIVSAAHLFVNDKEGIWKETSRRTVDESSRDDKMKS
jgi:hypothetical protein